MSPPGKVFVLPRNYAAGGRWIYSSQGLVERIYKLVRTTRGEEAVEARILVFNKIIN